MVFPLIAAPLLLEAVATTTTVLVELFVGGVAVGGAAVGGWWWFSKSSNTLPEAHQAVLLAQAQLTATRIDEARLKITALSELMLHLNNTVDTVNNDSKLSTKALHELVGKITQTILQLAVVVQGEKASCEKLATTLPALKEISSESVLMGMDAIFELTEFSRLLSNQEIDLGKTKAGIMGINSTLDQLMSALGQVEQLKLENERQQQRLLAQDEEIQALQSISQQFAQQCRFFKRVAMVKDEALAQGQLNQQHTGSNEHVRDTAAVNV